MRLKSARGHFCRWEWEGPRHQCTAEGKRHGGVCARWWQTERREEEGQEKQGQIYRCVLRERGGLQIRWVLFSEMTSSWFSLSHSYSVTHSNVQQGLTRSYMWQESCLSCVIPWWFSLLSSPILSSSQEVFCQMSELWLYFDSQQDSIVLTTWQHNFRYLMLLI